MHLVHLVHQKGFSYRMQRSRYEGVLLILHKTIFCDSSSEPSQQDDSDDGSQNMVLILHKTIFWDPSSEPSR